MTGAESFKESLEGTRIRTPRLADPTLKYLQVPGKGARYASVPGSYTSGPADMEKSESQ